MFARTIRSSEATGENADLYEPEIAYMGQVVQVTQCGSAGPNIIIPIINHLHQIRDGLSLGLFNFRVITFVVAGDVPSG
jgi:hypothetical protein